MPRRKKHTYKGNSLGKNIFLFLLAIGILLVISLFAKATDTRIQHVAEEKARQSLQLSTFYPTIPPKITIPETTKAPNPTTPPLPPYQPPQHGTCNPEEEINGCTCGNTDQVWLYCNGEDPSYGEPPDCLRQSTEVDEFCEGIKADNPGCKEYCMWKPVVYLYPEFPMFIDVEVIVPGNIYVSNPLYPNGGWKQVLANPNGNLTYQGKTYKELFYESDVDHVNPPDTGVVMETKKLEEKLRPLLLQYGFNNYETSEFLEFWVPKLSEYKKPYIQFSILGFKEKQRVDKLVIDPEPDTRIEMIAYFRLLDKEVKIKPLIIPKAPERKGFTIVEWGGVVEPE